MKYYEVDKKTIGTTKYCDPHIMESSSWSNEKLWMQIIFGIIWTILIPKLVNVRCN